eukprot:104884_1
MMLFLFITIGLVIGDSLIKNEECFGVNSVNIHPDISVDHEFISYSWSNHNNFTDIDDVVIQTPSELAVYDNIVQWIGYIVIKHGLQSVIGVTNIHKHFDLHQNEELVYQINPGFGSNDDNILYFGEPMDAEKQKELNCTKIPYIFKIVNYEQNKYTWAPMQFICASNDDLINDINLLTQSNVFNTFLTEVSHILISNGDMVQRITGIHWRCDKYFEFKKSFRDKNRVEQTFSNRTQILEVMDITQIDPKHDLFPTSYTFESDDDSNYQPIYTKTTMGELPELDQCDAVVQNKCDHCIYSSGSGHIYR